MRYLSLYGTEGFRSFLGILNGKAAYAPEKIPQIDPEITMEPDFSLRMMQIIMPYCDNHLKLRDIVPVLSSKFGALHSVTPNLSVWRPKNHLSLFSQQLLAGMFETFLAEQLDQDFSYFSHGDDMGVAFQEAFSLESKNIYINTNDLQVYPTSDANTNVRAIDYNQQKERQKNQKITTGSRNIFKIVGHMATIVEALYQTESTRQRFYNDLVSLVIPADDMEFVLAAYYLTKSKFPIKNVYVVSSRHRMVHNFIDKGEFKVTDAQFYEEISLTLDRLLFEASRASVEKVVLWKNELAQKGSFRVDSKTFASISKQFKSVFANRANCDVVIEDFEAKTNLKPSKISLCGMKLAQDLKEHVLVFESLNPELETTLPNFTS